MWQQKFEMGQQLTAGVSIAVRQPFFRVQFSVLKVGRRKRSLLDGTLENCVSVDHSMVCVAFVPPWPSYKISNTWAGVDLGCVVEVFLPVFFWEPLYTKAVGRSSRVEPDGSCVSDWLTGIVPVYLCPCQLYSNASGWTNKSQLDWCLFMYGRNRTTIVLLKHSVLLWVSWWYAVVVCFLTLTKPQRALKIFLMNCSPFSVKRKFGKL